ncbi:hypothetical protein M459_0209360 [Staphylococcus epidermidis Scl25]|nr:hypothetical protein M459_0209360 [Staphylococcus epidermidis Scl25]ESU03829.1 hypothetical protein M461_0206430 [Staphylococcus epidermidis CIM37]ESV09934.1 hypothetical protein M456_0206835 [Staphylococcus epidermidis MC28]ESV18671.1 hypothetical protein M464_0212760 [Staphylococcus epidermidis WI09]ESV38498.1 hypothetical protein M454_0204105 [Staphylococcus epidermidis MC16]ESV42677.1 hypothetical protein M455_0207565 [Staphylococcus epidermidis MC19]ESV48392.1 hypothetical protein M45
MLSACNHDFFSYVLEYLTYGTILIVYLNIWRSDYE